MKRQSGQGRHYYRSGVENGAGAGAGAGEVAGTAAGAAAGSIVASGGVPQRLRKKSIFKWAKESDKGFGDIFPKKPSVLLEYLERSSPLQTGLSLNLNKLHTFDFGFRFGIGFFWG